MVQTVYPFGLVPSFLQTPTLTVTDADKDQNTNFNTGVSTSLAPRQAIFIHRIIENISPKSMVEAAKVNNVVWVLSEDLSATSASGELTDPRSLMLGGWIDYKTLSTEGAGLQFKPMIRYLDLPIPIMTIAQKLNFLAEMVEQVAGTQPDYDVWLRLEYTIRNISNAMMQRLIQRLNLSPQP